MSLALDLWSNTNRDSILAVTAHYLARNARDGKIELRGFLLAFKFFDGSHTGENIAAKVFSMLRENGLLYHVSATILIFHISLDDLVFVQILAITMDNASNNNTFMDALERLMSGTGFGARSNRARLVAFSPILTIRPLTISLSCFPHIVNLVVKAFLSALDRPSLLELDPPVPYNLLQKGWASGQFYQWILPAFETSPLHQVRGFVSGFRASGQRRKTFHSWIVKCNESGVFGQNATTGEKVTVPVLQLLRECETRWSSTRNMAARVVDLLPVGIRTCIR
jgi:hypothetical protein